MDPQEPMHVTLFSHLFLHKEGVVRKKRGRVTAAEGQRREGEGVVLHAGA